MTQFKSIFSVALCASLAATSAATAQSVQKPALKATTAAATAAAVKPKFKVACPTLRAHFEGGAGFASHDYDVQFDAAGTPASGSAVTCYKSPFHTGVTLWNKGAPAACSQDCKVLRGSQGVCYGKVQLSQAACYNVNSPDQISVTFQTLPAAGNAWKAAAVKMKARPSGLKAEGSHFSQSYEWIGDQYQVKAQNSLPLGTVCVIAADKKGFDCTK